MTNVVDFHIFVLYSVIDIKEVSNTLNIDKENKENPNPEFNIQAYKRAISMIESGGGKYLDTPSSSAAGKYHFLYELIKKDKDMKGVSKRQFINNPDLQEKIMDKALSGNLAGYTYGVNYAKKLKKEYNSNHDVSELAALVHFLGPGNARKYLKNPNTFKVPGKVNSTAGQYISNFRKHFDKYNESNNIVKKIKSNAPEKASNLDFLNNLNSNSERNLSRVEVDNTSVSRQNTLNKTNIRQVDLSKNKIDFKTSLDFLENTFKEGGSLSSQSSGSGADKLVTLFENGGTHQENKHGGIPQGIGLNGKQNLVEEGETKWNDYIFSNSFSLDGTYSGDNNVSSNTFKHGGDL